MASLIDVLDESDFGLFILAPDDVTAIRDASKKTVRDNVIFELGLFVGRLGSERCFLVVPRGVEDLHLPTDLLGLTPANYEPDRQDGNMVASLGPACNRIRKAVARLGSIEPVAVAPCTVAVVPEKSDELISDPDDCITLIQSWMGGRSCSANRSAIRFTDVDRVLKMAPGSARLHIEVAARHYDYVVARKGKEIILFANGELLF